MYRSVGGVRGGSRQDGAEFMEAAIDERRLLVGERAGRIGGDELENGSPELLHVLILPRIPGSFIGVSAGGIGYGIVRV